MRYSCALQEHLTDALYEMLGSVVVRLTLCGWSVERKGSKNNSAGTFKAMFLKHQTELAPINALESSVS